VKRLAMLLPLAALIAAGAAAQGRGPETSAASAAQAATPVLTGQEVNALYAEAAELDRAGAYPAAEAMLVRILAAVEAATGADSLPTAGALRSWALQAANVAKFADAERALRRSLRIVEKFRGNRHPEYAVTQLELAQLFLLLDRADEAQPLAATALENLRRSYGPRHAVTAQAVVVTARLAQQQGRLAEAETLWNNALGLLQGGRKPNPADISAVMHGLAATYLYQHDAPAAIEMLGRVIATIEQSVGTQDPAYGLVLQSMAAVQVNEGSFVDARKTIEIAIATQRKILPPGHPVLGRSYVTLAEILALLDEADQVDAMFDLGEGMIVAAHTDRHPEYLSVMHQRISAYRQLGRLGEAEQLIARTEGLRKELRRSGVTL